MSRNHHPRRRLNLSLVWIVVVSTAGCSEGPTSEPLQPNVILISIDTLRADHLGAYGYERPTSPSIDRLAAQGARFTNAYSQSASTVPSHASLFTGRYPFEHGTFGYKTPLPDSELTAAEYFGQHSYRSFALTSSVRFADSSGFGQGFDRFERLQLPKRKRSASLILRAKEEIASDHAQPYFAFLHFIDPHEPYDPPEPFATKWHPGIPSLPATDTSTYIQARRELGAPVPDDTLAYLIALYDGEILSLDTMLGEFFDWLANRNDARGTLVVLTSDHGEEFKEHEGLSHAHNLHEELLRVPLLLHWPGRIAPGTTLDARVQGIDVLPTVIDLVGLPALDGLHGRSFAAELQGHPTTAPEDELNLIVAQQRPELWAIFADLYGPAPGSYKLASKHGEAPQLYHLDRDPGGFRNIAGEAPEVHNRLAALAQSLGLGNSDRSQTQPRGTTSAPNVSREEIEQLRALGYAEEIDAAPARLPSEERE